jgi:hypothetical protein
VSPLLVPHEGTLEESVRAALREVEIPQLVVVEESPDWRGELIFQAADPQSFYTRYRDWMSRYMVLNQLFNLGSFLDLIRQDGYRPVLSPSTAHILGNFNRWSTPLDIDGFTCPSRDDNPGELFPFQTFAINRALERAHQDKSTDRLFFFNLGTGTGKSICATAGAQELFNRDMIDLVCAFTLSASKINLATDAVASFARTTQLRAVVNDGGKRQRTAVYQQQVNRYPQYPHVFVMNYEKCWADFDELMALVKGRRVLWVFDESSKCVKATTPMTKMRKHLNQLVRASIPTVWPMSASVVDASPLRYRDVYNLSGIVDKNNPLGTRRDFQNRYARSFYGSQDLEWSRARLQEVRHRVAPMTQTARKTDPGVREQFKGMQTELILIQMSDPDRELYDLVVEDARREKERCGDEANLMSHYRLMRYICNTPESLTATQDALGMRLATEHPKLVTASHCAKMTMFLDQLEEIAGQEDKVVAFSHFTKLGMLLLAPHVKARGISHVLHYGVGQSTQESQEAQRKFKTDPKVTLFLSSDAGSHGLNLPEARFVINYEVPYSYDVLMQRSERINRADSKLDGMTSYCYVTEHTVEERIWEENNRRRKIAAAVQGTVETLDYGPPKSEEQAVDYLIFGK